MQARVDREAITWAGYLDAMYGRKNAYAALQDLIKSKVAEQFQQSYNTLRPQTPLKLGRTVIRNHLLHDDTLDPDLREERLRQLRSEQSKVRRRDRGKYAEGEIKKEWEERREAQSAAQAANLGLFGDEEPADAPPAPLRSDERYTLGHIAGVIGLGAFTHLHSQGKAQRGIFAVPSIV